jgi:hypothetical protein
MKARLALLSLALLSLPCAIKCFGLEAPYVALDCGGTQLGAPAPFTSDESANTIAGFLVISKEGKVIEIACLKDSVIKLPGGRALFRGQKVARVITDLGQPDTIRICPLLDDSVVEFAYYERFKLGMEFSNFEVGTIQVLERSRWERLYATK